jgi:1-deoxy-D-xylulose-5-phosphate synthase
MIVVLNDNEMSIGKNVGGMARYLSRLRVSPSYHRLKKGGRAFFRHLPLVGKPFVRLFDGAKERLKYALLKGKIFEQLGLLYLGRVDGHDLKQVVEFLNLARKAEKPVLLHVITKKGKGDARAEDDPATYHGLLPSDTAPGYSFSEAAGRTLCALAAADPRVTAVTAAMTEGVGLSTFQKLYPTRLFDVGIAEAHAVTMAAGLAAGGALPYVCIYSTFLQRAYDQILHDVCLQGLPVVFCADRAGVVGADGVTHQGVYDISYLGGMPHMTVLAPKDTAELSCMMKAAAGLGGPVAIRYPRVMTPHPFAATALNADACPDLDVFSWETLKNSDRPVTVLAVGDRMIALAADVLAARPDAFTLINARRVQPLDARAVQKIGGAVVTLEDGIARGGFGECVAAARGAQKTVVLAHPSGLIHHASVSAQLAQSGLTAEGLLAVLTQLTPPQSPL